MYYNRILILSFHWSCHLAFSFLDLWSTYWSIFKAIYLDKLSSCRRNASDIAFGSMKFYYRNGHFIFTHCVNQNALIYSTKFKLDRFLRYFKFSWHLASSIPTLILKIGPHFAVSIDEGEKNTVDGFLPGGIIVFMVLISAVENLRVGTGHSCFCWALLLGLGKMWGFMGIKDMLGGGIILIMMLLGEGMGSLSKGISRAKNYKLPSEEPLSPVPSQEIWFNYI